MDISSDSQKLPILDNKIFAKVARIAWKSFFNLKSNVFHRK